MKVLWVSTSIVGPAASIIESDYSRTSGTWIATEFEELNNEVEVVFLCGTRKKLNKTYEHNINENGEAFAVELPSPATGVFPSKSMLGMIREIVECVKPDIIHIWGTETCLQTAAAYVCPNIPKIVFIQGIMGVQSRYLGGYLKMSPKYFCSLKKLKQYYIKKMQDKLFITQGEYEKQILEKSHNVIVDNMFSKAYCNSIDDSINYYTKHLNANSVFKQVEWDYNECEKKTVFTVYGPNASKGIHQLLRAIKIVKEKHSDILLKIPGNYNFITDDKGKLICKNANCQPFEAWLYDYINNNKLNDNVCFVGRLAQQEMAQHLKKSHMFVNPSIMEVHALSLREAMTVGVPCISSVCGCVSEYMFNQQNGFLYRYEEHEVLAYFIDMLISNEKIAIEIGQKARESMLKETETTLLKDIYYDLISVDDEN